VLPLWCPLTRTQPQRSRSRNRLLATAEEGGVRSEERFKISGCLKIVFAISVRPPSVYCGIYVNSVLTVLVIVIIITLLDLSQSVWYRDVACISVEG
jgi:hypothetical protein